MASATQGYPVVSRMLDRVHGGVRADRWRVHRRSSTRELRATVERVVRLTPTIVEVVVRAPAAARRFAPGQFYRLQNFETLARKVDGTRLAMEGLALTGAWVDRARGLVSTIVLEMGGSSDLCAQLRTRRTGDPDGTDRSPDGNRGATSASSWSAVDSATRSCSRSRRRFVPRARACSISRATEHGRSLQGRRHRGRRRRRRLVLRRGSRLRPNRPQDRAFVGNMVQAMLAYADGTLGEQPIAVRGRRSRHRHRLRSDDGGRRAARHGVLQALSQGYAPRHRLRSTRRCNA